VAPSGRAVEERKGVSPSFVDPAPIINLVEAHLKTVSSGEKDDSRPQNKEKLKRFQGFPPNEGSGGVRPRPPDDHGTRAGRGVRFTLCIGPPSSQRQGL
jgi:hypothetical protein